MSNLLRQINETWELHYRHDLPRGEGCLAFVVDERCVQDEGIDFRVGVSFGDNVWPGGRPQGVLTPRPMPGRRCFGIHCVGTRGGRMALFDQWYDARPAEGRDDPGRDEEAARAILSTISDEEYRFMADPGGCKSPPPLATSKLLPLDQYEVAHDVEL